jgi:aminoglycoside 6'-N-acetyltransferase I
MQMGIQESRAIRKLSKDEKIPYELLLIADPTEEAINKYIFNSDIFVFEQNNKIVGIYAVQAIGGDRVEIRNMAVAAECQGRGIGRLLLRDAVLRAREAGYKVIRIGTGDASKKQLRLYQEEGFEVVGVRKNYFVDNYPEPIDEEGMRLKDMVMLEKELK